MPGKGLLLRNARLALGGAPTDLYLADGRVTACGDVRDTMPAEVIDLDGRTVLPGLWDAHVHVVQWTAARRRIDVSGAGSAAETAELIGRAGHGRAEPLIAHGFRDRLWADRPDKALLDAAVPSPPAIAVSHDLHTAWLNSAALALIGQSDHPTGVLRDSDCYAALAALPADLVEVTDADVVAEMERAAARGVVGIIDFEYADNVTDWRRRARGRSLPVRVEASIPADRLADAVDRELRTGATVPDTDDKVSVGPVKIFMDGSLNTRTALCYEPYPDAPAADAYGRRDTAPQELDRMLAACVKHGLTPALHAIGDRAVSDALHGLALAGSAGRIEHAQLVAAEDLPRFARHGVIASVQPAHLLDDRDAAEHHWAGRTGRSFCYADLLAAGATLELGSDAPVSPLDPWLGIAAAVARTDGDRPPWHPEQALSLDDALAAASRGRRGVRTGDPADLTILDGDPRTVSMAELADMPVYGTLVAGRWTYLR